LANQPSQLAKTLFFSILAAATLLTPTAAAQEGFTAKFYYVAGIVQAPPGTVDPANPWTVYSAPHVYKVLYRIGLDGSIQPVEAYTSATGLPGRYYEIEKQLRSILESILNQPGPGEPSSYYHVAIASDLTTARCGPAIRVAGSDSIAYYYNGILLFALVNAGYDPRTGLATYIYYSLEYGGDLCVDKLVDGLDVVVLALAGLLVTVYAFEGFRYARRALETIFSSEPGEPV